MTSDSNDAPHGGPSEAVPSLADDAILAPFREAEDPVLTTEEVGDSVPFRRTKAVEGLDRLASEGVLERKLVGDGAVWWLPGHTATEERDGPMPGTTREYESGLPKPVENEIWTLSAPDERERAAVYAACYYLSEEGPATGRRLRTAVYPDYSASHDDPDEWWTTCIRPSLAALSNVERADEGWRID